MVKKTSSFITVYELTTKRTKFLDHFKDIVWRILSHPAKSGNTERDSSILDPHVRAIPNGLHKKKYIKSIVHITTIQNVQPFKSSQTLWITNPINS